MEIDLYKWREKKTMPNGNVSLETISLTVETRFCETRSGIDASRCEQDNFHCKGLRSDDISDCRRGI